MAELYDPDLTQWLQLSGEHIVNLRPADERAEWVLLLLDEVNSHLTPEETAALLGDLKTGVDTRLEAARE